MDRVGALFHGGDDRGAADLLSGTASADLADGVAGVMYACVHARTRALSASLPGISFRRSSESRRVRRRVRKRECVHAELWGRGRSPCPSVVGPGLYACELVGLGSGVPVGGRACPQPCLHPGVRVCNPTGGRVIVHACVQAVLRTPPLCARVVLCTRRHVRMRTATFPLGASWTKFRRSSPSRTPPPFGRGMRALVYATRHVRMGRLPAEGRVNLCSCTQLSRQKAVVPCGARAGEWRGAGESARVCGAPDRGPARRPAAVVRSARWPTGTWRPTAGCDGARTGTGVGRCTISPARFEVARFAQDTCDIPAGEG